MMAHSGAKRADLTRAVALSLDGATGDEIAGELGVSRRTVVRMLGHPDALAAMEAVRQRVRTKMLDSADDMAGVLIEIATDEGAEQKDRISAAKALLDRSGLGPSSQVEHSGHVTSDVNDDEIEARLLALLEAVRHSKT